MDNSFSFLFYFTNLHQRKKGARFSNQKLINYNFIDTHTQKKTVFVFIFTFFFLLPSLGKFNAFFYRFENKLKIGNDFLRVPVFFEGDNFDDGIS